MLQLSTVPGKYARVERERRFLLADLPSEPPAMAVRTITDRYLIGTTLRPRHMADQRGGHQAMLAFRPPVYAMAEVTKDRRFTGGRLATVSREQLTAWLADYGVGPDHRPDLTQRRFDTRSERT